MTDIEENWPFNIIRPEEDEALYDLLIAIETELDYIDVQADELQEQRFIDTATTKELQKLASEVGVTRKTNESTERFRFRATLRKAIARSDGTFPDLAQILKLIFGDETSRLEITHSTNDPVVQIIIPSEMIDDLPVTQAKLEDILLDAIPASDGLDIITDETWLLGESGSQGLGQGGLS